MSDLPTIYGYASVMLNVQHYTRHIRPVAEELVRRGHDVRLLNPGQTPPMGAKVMVASLHDVHDLSGRDLIYIEHGAGQTYDGDPSTAGRPGYPGGGGCDRVSLFLCPREEVAAKWRARYPDATAAVVGAPLLDKWHQNPPTPDVPVRIAVTFHWPSEFSPEAGTAWPYYKPLISDRLVTRCLERGWSLIGHEHPRWDTNLLTEYKIMRVPQRSRYPDVMDQATLLVADNTSMLPEFASTGRPVLFLDSPEWRRDVDHGGRFWEWPKGQARCEDPMTLLDCIDMALDDPPAVQRARAEMVAKVYDFVDGKASERAADAIEEHLG